MLPSSAGEALYTMFKQNQLKRRLLDNATRVAKQREELLVAIMALVR